MSGKVLITRPEDGAAETAAEVRALGFEPLMAPVLKIEFLPFQMPENYAGLIFTSMNGVRAAAAGMTERRGRVFCVGDRTAEEARAAGWRDVVSAGGALENLEAVLESAAAGISGQLVYLSGFDISRNIESKNIKVKQVVVYKAVKAHALGEDCLAALSAGEVCAALFFSARSAEAFTELLQRHRCTQALKATKALCIADSVVKSLVRADWQDVRVARRPDRASLLDLLSHNAGGERTHGDE